MIMNKIINSLKSINHKLLWSLIILGLCPTIYTTVRTFFIGQMPNEWSYSIAGQLSWVNLLYEILQEAIILPLFFFIGKAINDKSELTNRIKTGLIISGGIYAVLSAIILIFAEPLLDFMCASPDIINDSISYIRIESIANIFSILFKFILVVLIELNKSRYVYLVTIIQLILNIIIDTFLVSSLPISMQLGVNGIGISNMITNIILFTISMIILHKENIDIFDKNKMSFEWCKNFIKIGGISGLESFVRNIAYMLMIARMVNVVNEQGTYWTANNFIWGWLLLPVTQLAELIKQEVSKDHNAVKKNTAGYFVITTIICLIWCISIPLWKPFMANILGYSDVDTLFSLVMTLLIFYIMYAYQNIFDAEFYGLGKTNYMLFESIVTNSIYYGTAFVLYATNVWTPDLTSIALLFGIGMAFDTIVSLAAYLYLRHKMNNTEFTKAKLKNN